MTIAEVVKPSLTVLLHAEWRGAQLGAGLGLAAVLPLSSRHPNKCPFALAADLAGRGALAGAAVITSVTVARLLSLDKAAIEKRADALRQNARQSTLDKVAAAGAASGLALTALRVHKAAAKSDESLMTTAFKPRMCWEAFGMSMAGAAVFVAVATLVRVVAERVSGKACAADDDAAATTETGDTQPLAPPANGDAGTDAAVRETVKEAIGSAVTTASADAPDSASATANAVAETDADDPTVQQA